ncbi:MAG TPA: ABC transporter permease [Gemmatimonadaceae bacterium]|nr:ABC transporter permease [Gemmatimonadaceae bacterium]
MNLELDIRQAFRGFRGAPAFAATVIAILALGIGLATAVFTVADTVLVRRLPVLDQDRIVVLNGEAPRKGLDNVPLRFDNAREFVRSTRTLARAGLFLYNGAVPVTIRDNGHASRLQVALVSGNYFDVLGARPLLGRAIRPEDDADGAPPLLVLSHHAWEERFGADANVLGRQMFIQQYGRAFTIIGVMPAGLDYPRSTDAWLPVLSVISRGAAAKYLDFDVIGRLASAATLSDARNEITAFFHRAGTDAFFADVHGVARALPALTLGDVRPAIVTFTLAATLLLVITCVNVANLLLVRGLSRVREIAIRTALGASRGRLIAQLLTEDAMLALAGGALGVGVAAVLVHGFVALAPNGTPRLDEIVVNRRMLLFAFAITAIATTLSSIVPALMAATTDVQRALRSDARVSASRGSRLVAEGLVSGQVALAVLVLSAAGLLARSLVRLEHADLAFQGTHMIVAELTLEGEQDEHGLIERILKSVQAVPGIQAASPVVSVPYSNARSWEGRPKAEGQSAQDAAHNPMVDLEVVGPEFFSTLGLPVTQGRAFMATDVSGAPAVVVLSESAARHYWPSENPIGKHMSAGFPALVTVIGVVPDTRYRDLRDPHSTMYFPLAQSPFPFAPTTLVLRTTRVAADAADAIRKAIADVAPGVSVARVTPFAQLLAGPLAQPRMNALLLIVFGLSAIALASVGLFGVLATMVRQRRRELGIRMTLGASPAEVARIVVRRGLTLAALGAASGLVVALGTNRVLASILFEVSPSDVVTLGVVAATVAVLAAVASAIPARTSSRIDPAIALRAD